VSSISSVQKWEYKPRHVAIGPCHFGRGLDRREEKIFCLEYLLHLRDPEGHVQLQVMVNALTQRNTTAVGFYHLLDSQVDAGAAFLEMLVRDGCYILYHLFKMPDIMSLNVDDVKDDVQAFLRTDTDSDIARDVLYLLENQIPFNVLETLYLTLVGTEKGTKMPLRKLMCVWVRDELQWQNFAQPSQKVLQGGYQPLPRWQHLLELVHMFLTVHLGHPAQPATTPPEAAKLCCVGLNCWFLNNKGTANIRLNDRKTKWHRATFYDDCAAVTFVHRPLDGVGACSILDVNLGSCGRLEIPPMTIDADTPTMLLNLMVLEMYSEGKDKDVTSHCFFMAKLAREVHDVAVLSVRNRSLTLIEREDDTRS
jgi:hypothetical protein